MRLPRTPLVALLLRFASRLRFPWLFGLTATMLAVDLLLPDPFPFVDELALGLLALLFAAWRKPVEVSGPGEAGEEPSRPAPAGGSGA